MNERNLSPELEQLYQVLKQIDEGKTIFEPDEDSIESWQIFQPTVRCLKKADSLQYIFGVEQVYGAVSVQGLTFDGEQVLKNPQLLHPQAKIDMSTTINQNINNSTIHGSVLVAETITNALNTVQNSQADNGVKELLTDLLKQISKLNNKVPAEKAPVIENMSRDAKSLVEEINSNQPRKRNALFSLEGMKEAAVQLGDTAKPIMELAEKLSPFLQTFI